MTTLNRGERLLEKSMDIVSIIFLVVIFTWSPTTAQDYTEIVSLGLNCTPLDTCAQNLSRSRDLQGLNERSCACDRLCTLYDDCCIDAHVNPTPSKKTQFACIDMRNYRGVFMIARCPPRRNAFDEKIKKGCEGPTDESDPIMNLPVTDSNESITYKNIHCATCHNKTYLGNLTIWQLRLEFDAITTDEHRGKNLSELVLRKPIYRDNKWGFMLKSEEDGLEYFREATVDAALPLQLETKIRVCKPDVIRDCVSDWSDDVVRKKCNTYQGALYVKDRDDTTRIGYRNAHCAMCNRADLEQLICKSPDQRSSYQFRSFNAMAFSVLVDVTDRNDVGVGLKVVCPEQQIYDVLFKKCRSLSCFKPDQILRDGKCETTPKTKRIKLPVDHSNLSSSSLVFVSCPQVLLATGEFVRLDNGSLKVSVYNQIYNSGEFRLSDEGAFVCAPNDTTRLTDKKFSSVMGYVTFICLSLSIFCLLLHLIFFVIVPDSQNLSSKNLASLSSCLFLAYLGFLIAQWDPIHKTTCLCLAIEMFYFFLSAFFWMNVMAFDVWRTLRMATRQLRVSSGRQWCRYLMYSLYGWLVPGFIVCAAVILDQTNTLQQGSPFRPAFATYWCWFGSRKALLVFFGAPMMTVMAANVVFFVSSARMILGTTKGTRKHTTQSANNRRNFRLYWKLAVMLGLSWSFGLVASYLNLETLWYVFVILNTLKGVFIFVAFTCNDKVKKYLQEKVVFVCRRRSSYRTSSLNSGSAFNSNSTVPSSNAAFKTSSTDLKTRSISSL